MILDKIRHMFKKDEEKMQTKFNVGAVVVCVEAGNNVDICEGACYTVRGVSVTSSGDNIVSLYDQNGLS